MRTLQDRAILLLNTIIGEKELESMLSSENAVLLQGGLFIKEHFEMFKAVNFGYHDRSLTSPYLAGSVSPVGGNSFQTPFSSLENDESQYLRVNVRWKTKSYDQAKWFEDHNRLIDMNEGIFKSLATLFDEDSVMDLTYDFEEFGGIATRFYTFGIRPRGGRVNFKFIAANTNLSDDPYFWNSLSIFIGSRYAVYVPAEALKADYAKIINELPDQIPWSEFEARYADKQYGK